MGSRRTVWRCRRKLGSAEIDSLYDFWGGRIASKLFEEADTVLNLASKEYSRCISDYLPEDKKMITCVFGELIDGKVKEKGTMVKNGPRGDGPVHGGKSYRGSGRHQKFRPSGLCLCRAAVRSANLRIF